MHPHPLNLVDFILKNRGENSFISFDRETIEEILRKHIMEDTIICCQDDKGNYTGVLLWSIEKWIPMRVYVEQLVAIKCGGRLLESLDNRMPPNYYIYAKRKGGTKTQVYKDPKKVVKLMKKLDMKGLV